MGKVHEDIAAIERRRDEERMRYERALIENRILWMEKMDKWRKPSLWRRVWMGLRKAVGW